LGFNSLKEASWDYAVLAKIEGNANTPPVTSNLQTNIIQDDGMALKNTSAIEMCDDYPAGAIIGVGDIYNSTGPFHLVFIADPSSVSLCDEATITVHLDTVLNEAWMRGGRLGTNIQVIGSQSIQIVPGEIGIIENLNFNPGELGFIDLQFYFFHGHSQESYNYQVILYKPSSDEIVGGKTCHIKMVSECEPWHRGLGDKGIFTTQFDSVQHNTKRSNDLAINKIVSLHPNPATDELIVTYELNEVKDAQISVSSYYHKTIYDNFVLDVQTQSRTLDLNNYPIGIYVVMLTCDGEVVDYKIFVKH
jgi:hypothetical protein